MIGIICGIIGIVISYILAFVACEYSSKMGIRYPQKEGYYYGMFTTCLTTFGFLIPGLIVLLLIILHFMGK